MSAFFAPDLSKPLSLPAQDSWPESKHQFDAQSVWAVRAAIAARRPLLLRGEPGIGKSQLARAVAEQLQVPFLYHVVDERSERDELLYSYDAVARLAEAQVSSLTAKEDLKWRSKLAEKNFIRPGVLWWAFNWDDALEQAAEFTKHCRTCKEPAKPIGWTPDSDRSCGPVVLVDEIITTNEERELPAAFLRRCLVLQMQFPNDQARAETFLITERARVFWSPAQVSDTVCKEVISQLLQERESARQDGLAVPGAAEFLDILRVLVELHGGDEPRQLTALKEISRFALKKNLEEVL